ncbi:MAG: hypothetical protein ACK2U9_10120, partial [Anaerolineae bacterium]
RNQNVQPSDILCKLTFVGFTGLKASRRAIIIPSRARNLWRLHLDTGCIINVTAGIPHSLA